MRRACHWTRMPGPLAQPPPGATRRRHSLHLIRHRAGPRSDPASRVPASHPRADDADQAPAPASATNPADAPDHGDLRQLKTEPRVCPPRRRRAGDLPSRAVRRRVTFRDRSWSWHARAYRVMNVSNGFTERSALIQNSYSPFLEGSPGNRYRSVKGIVRRQAMDGPDGRRSRDSGQRRGTQQADPPGHYWLPVLRRRPLQGPSPPAT